MNGVDIFLAIVILFAIIMGWNNGFILGSINLLSWTGSLVAAYLFYPYTARLLDQYFHPGVWLLPIAFFITALIVRLLIGLVMRLIIRIIPDSVNDSSVNKFLGIIPGAVNGWIYAIILSALLLSLPLKDGVTRSARNSFIANNMAMQSEWANRKLSPVFDEAVRQTINSLTIHPRSGESVSLPFKTERSVPAPDLEAAMLKMVNKERTSRGLKPVQADRELTVVARAHSKDMLVRGYFAHVSLDGKDPFQRMREANVVFLAAGENLALAQTLDIAHTNLMNSPGHRANILNPAFGRLGIGIMDAGFYGLMISQEFRD